jgi:hypothetical protein
MSRSIKLDLHTHPVEALKEKMGIKGIGDIDKSVASAIVGAIKDSGLDGIAITERHNFNHAWVAALEIEENFPGENLLILPGAEIEYKGQHFLQVYIPDRIRKRVPFFQGKEWFIILAHPGGYSPLDIEALGPVKFDAVEERSLVGDFPPAGPLSQERSISRIISSDAHKLEEIGRFYMELEINSR